MPVFGTYMFRAAMYEVSFFIFLIYFSLKSTLSDIAIAISVCSLGLEFFFFPFLYFKIVPIFKVKVSFYYMAERWILQLKPFS